MSPERLLQNFNQIAEAPDAVPRLRRFILDLAVRGKLVEQDPADEPASELLERIQAEKARLVKEGIIRMPSPVAPLDQTECLFDLPGSWQWIRLAEAGSIIGGGTPPSKDSECFTEGGKGVAWLTPADLGKHKSLLISHGERDLTEKGLASSSAQLMPAGSVLFTSRAPIGYTAIAENEISTNQGFKSVVPFIMDFNRYIAVYFKAFASWIDGKASGTTFKEVSGKIVANLPFPLPPLPEQHRIVAKVDELMALCDELEAAQQKRERRRDRLVAASLQRLNNGADAQSFREHARFHLRHLPRLTTRPEHIQQLRQTILNLAVRGKLVAQDPNDEPAAEFLKRIESKAARLTKSGELRNQQPLQPVKEGEMPFELPKHWKWVRLLSLGITRTGNTPSKNNPEYFGDYIPFVKPADLTGTEINYNGEGISREGLPYARLIPAGSVLMVCIGSSIGKVNCTTRDICCNQQINTITPFVADCEGFLALSLKADFFGKLLLGQAGTGTLPIISKGKWEKLPVPLPPLAEQYRIVAKVDELMALCDEMESRFNTTATTRHQLLEATLSEAMAQ